MHKINFAALPSPLYSRRHTSYCVCQLTVGAELNDYSHRIFFRTFCTNYYLKQKWCWHITRINWYWILFSQQIKTSHNIFSSWWGGNEWQTFSRMLAVKWGELLLTLSPWSPGEPGGPCNPGVPGRPWDHTHRDTHALSILYPKLLLTSIPPAVSQAMYLPNKSIKGSKRNKPQNTP